jgi:hypothetical protein
MIRVDAVSQHSNNTNIAHKEKDNSSVSFAGLLTAEIDKVSKVDSSKQPAESNNQPSSPEKENAASVKAEFERLLSMSPFELIRFQMLEQMGLTEESLKELPLDEQAKIEEQIKERIEDQMGNNVG